MPDVLDGRARWRAFSLLAATAFVLILDAAIVNVALPAIAKDLDASQSALSWVTSAYALTFGGFLLLGGRLSDMLGRRKLFTIGLSLFTLASAAGALAPNIELLITARAVQGFGAAIVTPAALSMVLTMFTAGAERNKALGLWGAVAGSGAAAGSILGGALTEWFDWEAVMWVNVPVGIVAVLLAPRMLPEGRGLESTRGFDFPGAISITAGVALGVYALVDANESGWGSAKIISMFALSLALIVAFVFIEARSKHPLVPLRVFKNRSMTAANVASLISTMAMFPLFFVLSLYLQDVLDMSPIQAGFGQLPIALMFVFGAGPVSKLVTKVGPKGPAIVGFLLMAGGIFWLSQITVDSTWLGSILVPIMITGIGGAMTFIPLTITATTGASASDSGLASGLLSTTQQVGGAIGLAITVAVSTAASESTAKGGELNPLVIMTDGFRSSLMVGAGLAVLAAIAALILLPGGKPKAPAASADGEAIEAEPVPVMAH
ncbi:MAG: DHA2 family efflux MFS transporter permease subunit [Corynebacteriales bacterium]|nr:DHA2 family efflux MFS transporter permease subunit [Mycobacteriales bacterium]